jgi:hypothetical protein
MRFVFTHTVVNNITLPIAYVVAMAAPVAAAILLFVI